MPLLGMGRDVPDGVMRLSEGRLEVDWTTETSLRLLRGRPRRACARSPAQLGGTYADNPLWWAKRVITVHPLGGAPMGRHAGEGLCDEYGEVFGHPGLYVLDGALLPGPVGANPSLTIAAVADRGCTHILESALRHALGAAGRGGRAATVTRPGDRGGLRGRSGSTACAFTEQMKGFVALGGDRPAVGPAAGRGQGTG